MPPRLLILSLRHTHPNVWSTSGYESEDAIAALDDADLVVLEPEPPRWSLPARLLRLAGRQAHFEVRPRPRIRPLTIDRSYDLCFVRVSSVFELDALRAVRGWRERCRTAVCWVDELWERQLPRRAGLEPLRWFDHVLLLTGQSAPALAQRLSMPVHGMPPALDTLRFCPFPDPPQRTIDLHSLGRRPERTHAALLELARRRRWFYLHMSTIAARYIEFTQHRELVADMLKRTRYWLVNKAKFDAIDERGDQEEMGFRFLEGAAAGAVLVGEPPDNATFRATMDWPDAVIRLPIDAADVAAVLDPLEGDPARVARIRRDNVVNCLRRHDWAHRWREILHLLGREPLPAVQARVDRLEATARAVADGRP